MKERRDVTRCGGCRKVVLNYQEPYLGTPEALAAAPQRAVEAQRQALIECSACRSVREGQSRMFAEYCERERARGVTGTIHMMTSGRETYGDHSSEWEDLATGNTGWL
jgi:hypothetical protein